MGRQELLVLAAYSTADDGYCFYFREIQRRTGLEIRQIRRAARSLARKGLTKYVRGLFNEDGEIAGSGYCCTREGRAALEAQND